MLSRFRFFRGAWLVGLVWLVDIPLTSSHRSTSTPRLRSSYASFLPLAVLRAAVTYQCDHLPTIRAVEDSFDICAIGVGKAEFEYVEVIFRVLRHAQTRAFLGLERGGVLVSQAKPSLS